MHIDMGMRAQAHTHAHTASPLLETNTMHKDTNTWKAACARRRAQQAARRTRQTVVTKRTSRR